MRSILFVQPIFVPNNLGLQVQLNSLTSLHEYVNKFGGKDIEGIEFCFGGWCAKEDYWYAVIDQLWAMHRYTNFKLHLDKYDRNYGKSYVVNKLFDKYHIGESYMFTCDSDICFDITDTSGSSIFARLLYLADVVSLNKPDGKEFGLFSLSQKELDCQLHNEYNRELTIEQEHLSWANHGGGMAGGALLISTVAWKKVGGYRLLVGNYNGGDDGFLMEDIHKANLFGAVTDTISIIHPWTEIKPGYAAKKKEIMSKCTGNIVDKKTFLTSLKEMDEFWKEVENVHLQHNPTAGV